MSEIPLHQLFSAYANTQLWEVKHYSLVDMIDARIAQAEAAEAYLEWILDTPTSSALEDYQSGLRLRREYVAAREVVRRMEKQT